MFGMGVKLALLATIAFVAQLIALLSTPEPIGFDGYYYAVQAETWLATGHLHAPDASWVLRFIAIVAWLAKDAIVGTKIAAALLAALTVPAAAFCASAASPTRDRHAAIIIAAGWATLSPAIAHLAGEYPKNLGAVPPLLFCAGAILACARDRRWILPAIVAAAIAATAHKTAAVFVALIALEIALVRLRRAWIAIAAGALVFAIASALAANLLHPSDLARVTSQLDPSLWPPPPFRYFVARPVTFVEAIELCLPWLALVFAAVCALRRQQPPPFVLVALAAVLPIWRTDAVDLGFRVALFSPMLIAPLLIGRQRARPFFVNLAPFAAVLALPIALAVRGDDVTPPNATYRKVIAAIPRPLPELLIVHTGFNFLYHHETSHEAMAWAPEPDLDATHIFRLVHGVRPNEWSAYLPTDTPPPVSLPAGYSYWREDHYRGFVAQVRDNSELEERLQNERNPHAQRPRFLQRNHR